MVAKKGRRTGQPRSGEKRPREKRDGPVSNKKQGVEAMGLSGPDKASDRGADQAVRVQAAGSPSVVVVPSGAPASRVTTWDDTPACLTLNYSLLIDIYNDLMTLFGIRRSRSQYLTFSEAQRAILEMSKLRLSIKQLQQLKHVLPECLEWEYVITGTSASVTGDNLLLRQTRQRDLKNLLRGRLIRLTEEARADGKEPPELELASLPDPALAILASPNKRKCSMTRTPSSQGKAGSQVMSPETIQGPRPHKPPRPNDELKSAPTFSKTERELFRSESQCQKSLTPAHGAATDRDGNQDENMCEANQEAKKWSPAASQTLIANKLGASIVCSSADVPDRQLGYALSNILRTFDQVRMSFLRARTKGRPLNQVVANLKKGMGGGSIDIDTDAVRLGLQLLLDHAPQFLRLESGDGRRPDLLTVNQGCNVKELRAHLRGVAEAHH